MCEKRVGYQVFGWAKKMCVRPFRTQSDLSVENGHFRLKRKSGLHTQLFRLNFFRLSFLTGRSSRKTQSKKMYTRFCNPWHRSSHHKAHPHTHTYQVPHRQQYHTTAPTLAWLSPLLLVAASQRGAFLAPLASSVNHTTTAARGIDAILPTTATPAVALAALG